jgi:hypothetical protein
MTEIAQHGFDNRPACNDASQPNKDRCRLQGNKDLTGGKGFMVVVKIMFRCSDVILLQPLMPSSLFSEHIDGKRYQRDLTNPSRIVIRVKANTDAGFRHAGMMFTIVWTGLYKQAGVD